MHGAVAQYLVTTLSSRVIDSRDDGRSFRVAQHSRFVERAD